MTALLLALLLAACSSGKLNLPEEQAAVQGAYGIAIADEPQAALIGRDVLTAGGNAADAAVAMYFVMAVSLPSAASLGGGGLCLVFAPADRKVEVLEFLARAPASPPTATTVDRPTAVPGNVRGFFALHARYGHERWEELITPAETLARFGMPVSRALAQEVRPVEHALAQDAEFRRIFAPTGGPLAEEGERVVQLDLATMLARIRSEGAGDFYTGQAATKLIEGTNAAGGALDRADLQAYLPAWQPPLVVTGNDAAAYFPAPPPAAGGIQGQMWALLTDGDRYARAAAAERPALIANATLRTFAEAERRGAAAPADPQALVARTQVAQLPTAGPDSARGGHGGGQPKPENPSAAGLIAVDGTGMAVACSVTLNSPFGTGRIAPGTGVVLAALPGPGGRGAAMVAPMLVTVSDNRGFAFAATASGGIAAPPALIEVAARALLADQPLNPALDAGRLLSVPDSERIIVEGRMNAGNVAALSRQGPVAVTGSLGRVNAAHCPEGLPDDFASCQAAADPRGFGLALTTR